MEEKIEDIKMSLYRIPNNTIEYIKEQYHILISKYHNNFFNNIKDTIMEEIRGIPEYKIEEWCEEILTDKVKSKCIYNINELEEQLVEKTVILANRLENSYQDNSKFMKNYEESLKEIANSINLYWLDEIIEEFKVEIKRKLTYYCDPFSGYSQQNIESIIDEIGYIAKNKVSNIIPNYIEEYNQIIKTELNKNIIKTREIINELEQEMELTEEEIQEYSEKMRYSGFELIRKGDKLYLQKITDKDKITEIKYDKEKKALISVNKKFYCMIKENEYYSFDKNRKKIFIINDKSIQVLSEDRERYNAILRKNFNYEFYYGYQRVTNIEEIKIVIDEIKTSSPQYYKELLTDQFFKLIIDKIEKHEEETEEIFKDKMDGKIKINPLTKDLVTKKLRLFGFMPVEKEDGLYLKDLMTNEEHKMKTTSTWTTDGFQKHEYMYTDLNIIDKKISLHNLIIQKANSRLHIEDNLSKFKIRIGDKLYIIQLTETGLICRENSKFTNSQNISLEELKTNIKDEYPFVVEYIEQHLVKIQKNQHVSTNEQGKNVSVDYQNINDTIRQPNRKR